MLRDNNLFPHFKVRFFFFLHLFLLGTKQWCKEPVKKIKETGLRKAHNDFSILSIFLHFIGEYYSFPWNHVYCSTKGDNSKPNPIRKKKTEKGGGQKKKRCFCVRAGARDIFKKLLQCRKTHLLQLGDSQDSSTMEKSLSKQQMPPFDVFCIFILLVTSLLDCLCFLVCFIVRACLAV